MEAKSTQFVSSRHVVRRVGWGIRPRSNIQAWFTGIMVHLPKRWEGVWRGERDALEHVGFEVLVGCQADVQPEHGIRDNFMGESLTEINVGGGDRTTFERMLVKERKQAAP